MQLKLNTRIEDGVIVVMCSGRIVLGEESAHLRDTIRKLLTERNRVVLNLAETSYIDSGGLGTLVGLYTTARSHDTAIKLANVTERVDDLLHITKLVSVFEVYNSEKEAIDSFKHAA